MEINIKQAVSNFYPNPSYEQIYFEAVTNALDAGADKISIQIKLESFDRPDTLGSDPEVVMRFNPLLTGHCSHG